MSEVAQTSRRTFLSAAAVTLADCSTRFRSPAADRPLIDIHQHTNYLGRTDQQLIEHQHNLGAKKTILLPAGSKYGLNAGAGGNDTVLYLAKRYPRQFSFFANELPNIPQTKSVLEKYLAAGAIGIGEQKFHVECDSRYMQLIADVARDHHVPVLMHFEYEKYNMGFERFHRMLEQYPTVNFIGHAQTFWGNIDRNHEQAVLYPKGRVTPGGITDRLLSDYHNMYGDLSAGSGLNALLRDEDHARRLLERHQNKLLFGSDCSDREGSGSSCIGANQLTTIVRLARSPRILRKILHDNAAKLLQIA